MGIKRSRQDSVSSSEDPSTPYSREQSVDVKLVHLDTHSAMSEQPAVIKCSLPPHQPLEFASFEEYNVHHKKTHMNRCSECQRNFPDEHFLHLHIGENHDPFNAAKRDEGERTYACLLPDCDRLCSTPQKRRLHCIDKHQFPRNYDFYIVNDGIDRRSSMLQSPHRRRSSTLNSSNGTSTAPGKRGGESSANTAGEGMDVVKDHDEDQHEEGDEQADRVKRTPVKLRGRGGFGHARTPSHGQVTPATVSHPDAASPSQTASKDPMDSLASSMSALQFVPHSVRAARGRGRGRGG
ncbi:hypothetical protein P153DRAFT_352157 [Dothidotthia symphoricarpi CBS 119687]|uniref:C2H2-type domain-containing protein n=1 Tax=Dothidotthia symphoricarpi CBS 119687 TaxID=1392245 RepID=A0A6A5ZYL7_9PLEO|nr:uncharacterized protein P153DRAFT_352157 [Dothidotthia symphoricarpi CBS 119687]KAF2123478.1 hypothetical protein P153DRAFT_352157 [Dothidotthia symphoricarpi CBS 119687]